MVLHISLVAGQNINRQKVNQLLLQLQKSKPDSNRISILVELGKFHVYKQGEAKVDLDSSYKYLNEANHLSDSLHLLKWQHESECMLIIVTMERGDNKNGRLQFSKLLKECERTGDKEGEAKLRFRFGIWLSTQERYQPEALDHYYRAAAIYKSLNNHQQESEVLFNTASIHLGQGKLKLAEDELFEILNIYKAINYLNLHYTYNELSSIYRLKGDLDKALKYSLLCIESMNTAKDSIKAATFYQDAAMIYNDLGNYDKGIEYFKKSFQKWRMEKLPEFGLYLCASYIVRDMIMNNKTREAFALIKSVEREIPLFR